MIQSDVACSKDVLRASEKDPVHGCSMTLAPNSCAISIVRSVDPVSTMMISSTAGATAARHLGSISSSSLTIMHRLSVRPLAGWALGGQLAGTGGEAGDRGVQGLARAVALAAQRELDRLRLRWGRAGSSRWAALNRS